MSSTPARRARRSGDKVALAAPQPEPRQLAELQQEAARAEQNAGRIQYHIKVLEADLEKTNETLLALNREAAARNELDRKAAATPPQEPSNEQS